MLLERQHAMDLAGACQFLSTSPKGHSVNSDEDGPPDRLLSSSLDGLDSSCGQRLSSLHL